MVVIVAHAGDLRSCPQVRILHTAVGIDAAPLAYGYGQARWTSWRRGPLLERCEHGKLQSINLIIGLLTDFI